MQRPFAITGLGLAGSLLSWELLERGVAFTVWDEPLPGAASPMAPGLLNPLAGPKLKPAAPVEAWLDLGHRRYAAIEAATGQRFWHPLPLLRVLRSEAQAEQLQVRLREPHAQPFIGDVYPPGHWSAHLADPHGSFVTLRAGWLDIAGLVTATRAHLDVLGRLQSTASDGPPEQGRLVIDAQGWRASTDPRWAHVPFKPARGETLTLRIPECALPQRIHNFGWWLRPESATTWRAGATYAWSAFEAGPTVGARLQLMQALREHLRVPWACIDQHAGTRPAIDDYQPVLGRHPEAPDCAILNGFGSQGVLYGPAAAGALADHLLEGKALPGAWDVQRFWR